MKAMGSQLQNWKMVLKMPRMASSTALGINILGSGTTLGTIDIRQ